MQAPSGSSSRNMSRKRKLLEDNRDDDYSAGIESEMGKFLGGSTKKHTIDSDDEDEVLDSDQYNKQKHNVMNEEDIEGQEDETLEFDGETKITPFNMQDELEEGYFDGNGMYIWNKKDSEEVKDSWLDSVDWVKVRKPDDKPSKKDSESEEEITASDVSSFYKEILGFLNPKETVLKAIKRLGGGNKQLSASERLKQKKLAKKQGLSQDNAAGSSSVPNPNEESNASQVNQLTALVNKIMYGTGYMDIYDETYESINFKLAKEKETSTAVKRPSYF